MKRRGKIRNGTESTIKDQDQNCYEEKDGIEPKSGNNIPRKDSEVDSECEHQALMDE